MTSSSHLKPQASSLFALIPAAGHSTRMGRPKLALPLGNRTVLERVIDALKQAGTDVLVVLGPHVAELTDSARAAGAMVLELPEATPNMRATIEAGLGHLETVCQPDPIEPWLLAPADHPVLDIALIRNMIEAFARHPAHSVCVPSFGGRRGHPTLIRWKHWPGIRAYARDEGLNKYLRQFQSETLEVPADSPDVLLDLDTPEDYEQLRARFM
jgi:molybdenum cofactor cytidylyltransferase